MRYLSREYSRFDALGDKAPHDERLHPNNTNMFYERRHAL